MRPVGKLIAKPRQPKPLIAARQLHRADFLMNLARFIESPANERNLARPPIVISKDRIDAERRL